MAAVAFLAVASIVLYKVVHSPAVTRDLHSGNECKGDVELVLRNSGAQGEERVAPPSGPPPAQQQQNQKQRRRSWSPRKKVWVKHFSEAHSAPYWHNSLTGETTWTRPDPRDEAATRIQSQWRGEMARTSFLAQLEEAEAAEAAGGAIVQYEDEGGGSDGARRPQRKPSIEADLPLRVHRLSLLNPDDAATASGDAGEPKWIPDADAKTCMRCNTTVFSLTKRKHHCRACGPSDFCRALFQIERTAFHSDGRDAHACGVPCVLSTGFVIGQCCSRQASIKGSANLQRVCTACFDSLAEDGHVSLRTRFSSHHLGVHVSLSDDDL